MISDPGSTSSADAVERLVRAEYTRILATLIRVTGDVGLAEDAVQEAVIRALNTWPRDGVPDEPRAWLTVAARRCAIDRVRRESVRDAKEAEAVWLLDRDPAEPSESVIRDDQLRLIFTCCHPTLSWEAQVALSLRTLGGLTTAEVARALLVPEATMAKRLTRAKQKIQQAHIPYKVPADAELPARLRGVLSTVYLIFNEGYASGSDSGAVRQSLVDEAIRLGRLVHELMPDEAGATGLLALMLLQDSRRATRIAADGVAVPLSDQDRAQWDRDQIRAGVELVGDGLRRTRHRPDPYVVQAAIAACHALAPTYSDTEWSAITSWYDVLLTVQDDPVVRLARAAAVAEQDGPAAGLRAADDVVGLDGYAWWHASRAELLVRLDRRAEAVDALARAEALGLGRSHVARLRLRLDEA